MIDLVEKRSLDFFSASNSIKLEALVLVEWWEECLEWWWLLPSITGADEEEGEAAGVTEAFLLLCLEEWWEEWLEWWWEEEW